MLNKILLIDDDATYLQEAKELLEENGFTCCTCSDSLKACEILSRDIFHCILLDIHMPKLDGEDLLHILHKKFPDIPIIIVSGYSQDKEAYLLKEGASRVVSKPFNTEYLISAITEAISGEGEITPLLLHGYNLKEIQDTLLRKIVIKALAKCNFNITQSARLLHISRPSLIRYIQRLHIHY